MIVKHQKPTQSIDVIRNPYFLEFLGLEKRSEYSESELEKAICFQMLSSIARQESLGGFYQKGDWRVNVNHKTFF
ncbi:hypothetical protein M2137_003023 [Parabacteroides sp. PFB2-10]|uniref:hypothetical protein n=1 Tax=Parabacteroides sp. PFB2-10 TaxID=1742405 RepID=UPI00247723FA|nr:hypothetical protein [Parabacteroides sp. PFB2-10]MDH6314225.1 hypothetical protein [Parabacteroides sp. PFB2-10]